MGDRRLEGLSARAAGGLIERAIGGAQAGRAECVNFRFAPTDKVIVQRCRPTSRAKGLTLLEVLWVVLILAILGALTVPMMGQSNADQLRAAADMLIADLAYAQVQSITHSDDPRVVVFDSAGHGYRIAAASEPDMPIDHPADHEPFEVIFGQRRAANLQGVTIQSYDLGGDDRIAFGPYGQLDQTTPATLTLAAKGLTLPLTIDPVSGEASVSQIQ